VARGPFVLVHVAGAALVREQLRDRGFAVRRGDTFPGLGPDWLRIAVRPEAVTDAFLKVWQDVLG
jgi:histidinol-phosphate aminotransferase